MGKFDPEDLSDFTEKADLYAEVCHAGLAIVSSFQGKFPIQEIADKLKEIFTKDLAPLIKLVDDGVMSMSSTTAHRQAKLVRELMRDYGVEEKTAYAIVSNTDQNIRESIRNSIDSNLKTKKA